MGLKADPCFQVTLRRGDRVSLEGEGVRTSPRRGWVQRAGREKVASIMVSQPLAVYVLQLTRCWHFPDSLKSGIIKG